MRVPSEGPLANLRRDTFSFSPLGVGTPPPAFDVARSGAEAAGLHPKGQFRQACASYIYGWNKGGKRPHTHTWMEEPKIIFDCWTNLLIRRCTYLVSHLSLSPSPRSSSPFSSPIP